MTKIPKPPGLLGLTILAALPLTLGSLHAADGTWTSDANGNWNDIANWNSGAGPIADGADFTATLDDVITGNRTITNDGRTIGNITVLDTSHNYTISSSTLTLDVTAGSPTVSVPAGRTLTIGSVVAGADGFTKTGDGTLTFNGNNTLDGNVTISGGLVNWKQTGTRTFDTLSGSGDLFRVSGNTTLSILDGSAFTGNLATGAGGNGQTIEFQSMGDAVGSGNLITRGGSGDSNQTTTFRLYGDLAPVTFNNRAIEIQPRQSTPRNWSSKRTILQSNNATPANAWVINTNLVNETDRDHLLQLEGSNSGDNTFAGVIGDSTGIGGLGAFYSTQTGGLSLLKDGSGKWILSGVNTYTKSSSVTAGTVVYNGTLVIGGAGQLGAGTYAESISINGGAELIVDSSAANTFTGPFTGASGTFLPNSTGTGTLTQTGTGVLTLGDGTNNAGLNDFMALSVDTGSVVNLDYASGNVDTVLQLNLGGVAVPAGEYGHTNSGADNGGAGVGTYDAYFAANTGIINNLGGDTTAIDIAFFDGGTADIDPGGGNATSNVTAGTSTWDDTVKNWDYGPGVDHAAWLNTTTAEAVFQGSTNRNINVASDVNVGTITLKSYGYNFNDTNTITFGATGVIDAQTDNNRTRNVDFNCNVAGGDITLTGTGFCKINGTATFSSFTINTTSGQGGIGELGSGTYNGFGPGVLTINSNCSFFSTNNDPTDIPNDMVWNSNFRIENVSNSGKVMTFDGDVTMGANITLSSKHRLDLNGVISDGGNNYQLKLEDNGGGANFHLNGANTFGGGVWWAEDSITINNAAGLGTGTFLIDGALSTMDNLSGGSITLSTNNAITLDDNFTFAGSNDLNMGTGAVTLTNSRTVTVNGGTLTFGGPVGQSGTRALTKAGAGTLALGGANTYTGNTAVNAGTLALTGGSQSSAITVGASGNIEFTLGSTITSTAALTLNGTVSISGAVDNASDYQLMTLTGGPTIGGTPTLVAPITDYILETRESDTELWLTYTGTGGSPYETWATGGELFGDDANDDGVTNGLAFLLGAAGPNADATGLLPVPTEDGSGNLVLEFDMLDSASRGTATLSVEHSSDLGISDTWTVVAVPDTSGGPTSGVTFTVSGGPGTLDVTASISASEAAGGKLFGRVTATE